VAAGLHSLSLLSLSVAGLCALIVLIHIVAGHPQHMWIMNVVWVTTALYTGPVGLWAYFRWGTLSTHRVMMRAREHGEEMPPSQQAPYWSQVAVGATHCGAGCTLGDICAESFIAWTPLTLFGRPIFATWVVDYAFAFAFGIAFQYFTIAPMRHLSPVQGLKAALKADFLSITAWQFGMYGWMAIVMFGLVGHELPKDSPVFWFQMQIAMLCGLITSYPVNWWLLRSGIKEAM
jgi:hypothetical protein